MVVTLGVERLPGLPRSIERAAPPVDGDSVRVPGGVRLSVEERLAEDDVLLVSDDELPELRALLLELLLNKGVVVREPLHRRHLVGRGEVLRQEFQVPLAEDVV